MYQLLSGLSNNKATGIDKISCKIINIATPAIADSKKAFYTVNHDILLKKMKLCGIKGQALDLLKSVAAELERLGGAKPPPKYLLGKYKIMK